MIHIRRSEAGDIDAIWEIFHQVCLNGDTYPHPPSTTREETELYWLSDKKLNYVAVLDGHVVGAYTIDPNQCGLGSHVAHAGYIVKQELRRKGIGKALCHHSLHTARKFHYKAMQYNLVVKSNPSALLWKLMGFKVVGTVPKAFHHLPTDSLVDCFVMHRFLDCLQDIEGLANYQVEE